MLTLLAKRDSGEFAGHPSLLLQETELKGGRDNIVPFDLTAQC